MTTKTAKCCGCKDRFPSETMINLNGSRFHSYECATSYAQAKAKKARERQAARVKREEKVKQIADRAKHRENLKRVRRKPRAEALEAAQLLARVSNADDNGYCTCASCGIVQKWNEMDGGHFIAKGDSSYWSLDPRNIFPQCKPCNGFAMKHGTAAITYTTWMINRFGAEFVEEMIAKKKTVCKRSVVFYDEFIKQAKKEIEEHKARIS